ncbi:hypothetical protein [Halorientalis salina]|uniref:hypothetical protein n=1 Tax=Halorientalis salina TaxID=2932266 RepID=UPI0010AB5B1F|nr:hypothetical protein [Halorientalis salina]
MTEKTEPDEDTVAVSMEISGKYDDVIAKLQSGGSRRPGIEPFVDDLAVLLDTVVEMGGGTRSAIAQQLPSDMAASYDAQAVVDTLQVLERYDLVVLEGNTWKPGPKLEE